MYRITLIVPRARDKRTVRLEEMFIDNFGGYTVQDSAGGWKNDDREIYKDLNATYTVLTDKSSIHLYFLLDSICEWVLKAYNQVAVFRLVEKVDTAGEDYLYSRPPLSKLQFEG